MLTGKSPRLHGCYGYREGIDFPAAYPVTLPSTLRDAGYQTFGVGKTHVYPERARCGLDDALLHDGFLHAARRPHGGASPVVNDYVEFLRRETGNPRADYHDTALGCNAITARPFDRDERLHPTRCVADESLRFLERRDPTWPFFLYLSFHRPHAPLDPPAWLWDKYHGRSFAPRPVGAWVADFAEHRVDDASESQFGSHKDSTHQTAKAAYYGSIEFIDLQLNRLRAALIDHQLADNTVILFVSDHGDMMGDHDMYRKSVAYEGSAHIPLLAYVPPRLREGWGQAWPHRRARGATRPHAHGAGRDRRRRARRGRRRCARGGPAGPDGGQLGAALRRCTLAPSPAAVTVRTCSASSGGRSTPTIDAVNLCST
ncbi:hypothetical protein BSZ39_07190 [Bowdeniella nasicola]|uniref:Sulfatase N-terminal domain-containing protein n=1 Tax=Bowdeniella nasicola TaxID=208480 RepID=A0A1Q5Q1X4_9ACTO|nr:hypothetical protein BSZ39_07190 [Bowdeniella nasicola]